MKLAEIRSMPKTVRAIPAGTSGVHESCLRSFHILNKVLELLVYETPHQVILEIVEDLRTADGAGIPIVGEAR